MACDSSCVTGTLLASFFIFRRLSALENSGRGGLPGEATLAIAEYLNEIRPQAGLLPADPPHGPLSRAQADINRNTTHLARMPLDPRRLRELQLKAGATAVTDLLVTKGNQAAILEGFQKTTDSCVSGCADAFAQMVKARPDTTSMQAWFNGLF